MSPSADASPRLGAKRSRSPSPSESADEGPLPPPPVADQQDLTGATGDDSDDDDDDVGPMPPPPPSASTSSAQTPSSKRLKSAKKQQQQQQAPPAPRTLPHESLYLAALPSASRYHQSFMHRAPINFSTVTPHTNFLITTSVDGHIKFWKKQEVGIEFVKHYRAHLGVVTAVSVSADGAMFATAGSDKSLKIFDVVNFDLINMIKVDYVPRAICWIHRKGRAEVVLAVSAEDSNVIRLYDGRGDGSPSAVIDSVHRKPVHLLTYHEPLNCVVSADERGMVEYWSPEEPYEKPDSRGGLWEYKASTDLFDFKKSKSIPSSLVFSPSYKRFVTHSLPDRVIRVFDAYTGKIIQKFDESLAIIQEMQTAGTSGVKLDDMEFGRRLAAEKMLDREAQELGGAINAAQGLRVMNAVFDETGHFLIYPTMLGIKVINTYTNELSTILGRDETVRFLNISLFQGIGGDKKKGTKSLALMASENPAAAQSGDGEVQDPTLFCSGHKRERFYLFTRLEPDHNPKSKEGAERDVFNEKPSREEQTIAASSSSSLGGGVGGAYGSRSKSTVASTAILHTTLGDIQLRLFPEKVHKTVENFVGLARKGYYNDVTFHRVIRKFMLQTGDPLGDGTGGESLWGRNFEDEFRDDLKHDRPYTLSMANAGPNTNGSQFFITTVPTPWLDNKHTIFGRATAGMDVVHRIENVKVDSNDKPREEVRILNITLS